ncbi:hypothetical protein [Corynebacterium halotolerans]|nr:hypothetical protein [Corynebacterium halotolerans]
MEFEEFSRQFRERTAQRMLDFEAALARAQNRMERATQTEQSRARQRPPAAGQPGPVVHRRPRPPGPGHGEVRGILKRG